MSLLAVKGIGFGYTQEYVFRNLDLKLEHGEAFCLFGPNGCGKTTFLDCITGFHKVKEGKINLQGRDLALCTVPETARIISYVPQTHEKTFPYLVKEVVLMGRTAHVSRFSSPQKKDERIAEEAIESLNISHLADRNYATLSGGETRLVMLARALAQDSPLILMDEPASHLDLDHELMLLEKITGLIHEKKKSIVFSSHSPNHAYYFENHGINVCVGLMHNGNFIAKGKPRDVLCEENIRKVFNIDSKILKTNAVNNGNFTYLVPIKTIKKTEN